MPALCDVNVLLALTVEGHVFHPAARLWFESQTARQAVVCRISQLGLLRLLGNRHVMNDRPLDLSASWATWQTLSEDGRIKVAFEEPPALDSLLNELLEGKTVRRDYWTDAYLAAFALSADHTLVTFDKGFQSFPGLNVHLLRPSQDST